MNKQSRRSFVKTATAAAASTMIIPSLLSNSPNKKLNLAFIGVGGRGGRNLKSCDIKNAAGESKHNIVALCDVSDTRAAQAYKNYPKAKRFTDFRKMFDKMGKKIDAVAVSTPDHTHFAACMAAMQLGIHVYVEKPMAHNVWQLRTLTKAAKHYKVVNELGNQGHTTDGVRRVKDWYDNGVLGQVNEVIAWFNGPHFSDTGYFNKPKQFPPKKAAIPEGLDWDSWLGPVKDMNYSRYYQPKVWRGWYEFGNGELGDWACHTLDAPFWALDLGMPTSVQSVSKSGADMGHSFVSDQSHVEWSFPARGDKAPVTLRWYEGGLQPPIRPEWGLDKLPNSGMIMVGSKASVMTGGRPDNSKLMVSEEEAKAINKSLKNKQKRVKENDPQGEFIRAITGEGPMPGSDFEYGAALTEMALIGVLAQRFHTRIDYDAKNMRVTNHKNFEQFIKEPVREGWSYGEELWS